MKKQLEFKVEKNIKMPVSVSHDGGIYPFGKMEVGDSFLVEDARMVQACRNSASYYHVRHPSVFFSVRKLPDGTFRCWRIK